MDLTIKNLHTDWKFHLGECDRAWYRGYDDSHWNQVMLPHDWSVSLPFSPVYSSGTGYLAGGIGWYRLKFALPEEWQGKSIRIVFDGVYKNSQVWCNSYYLGKRPSGYTSFTYDISDLVNFGSTENVISVKVTHTDLADSRWFTGSGITRKVTLVAEERIHPAEYGIFFQASRISRETAQLKVTQEIVNTLPTEKEIGVETVFSDREGQECLRLTGSIMIKGDAGDQLVMEGNLSSPQLWSDRTPNLYKMSTYYTVDRERYLADETRVGIRDIRFDPDKGFFLNGTEQKLKGVCVHHDAGCLGAAVTREVWIRRLETLKKCGCNAIRCSHNPHMPQLYELCDEMGFLVMDEAFDEWENAKNKWSTGHNVYPPKHQGYYEDFPQWHEADLRAMVRRDRNHPSVVMWSIGNEIDYPNDPYCHPMFDTMTGNNDAAKPEAERSYDSNKPNAERMAVLGQKLVKIVKQEDLSRPVTLAAAFPELSSRLGLYEHLDVVGYNYKEHLYEEDHKRFPQKPFIGSENSHSYEAWMHVRNKPYISGQFLWTGIDYLGEARGWPVRGSKAGIITCAGYEKPEFNRRKAMWTDSKVLHITTCPDTGEDRRWTPAKDSWNYVEGREIIVKCYSNLQEVALYLNGDEIGRQREYQEDGAYVFKTAFQPGMLTAVGYDERGQEQQRRTLTTAGNAEVLSCELWKPENVNISSYAVKETEPGFLYQLEIKLEDKNGNIPVHDDRMVCVTVCRGGELAGLESGNLEDVTSYALNYRRTFDGRLIAYIRRTGNGTIYITIEADLIKPVIVETMIKPGEGLLIS